ncbi:hypothetical protein SAMN04489835_3939 [Mycolicibacterium rutilum]|uniref:DUF4352 domain-containing protein n=1 Tax=Mycolicibacterium rutilum TaxID=370526 RepID=A0A1H6KTE1_MYCRU|nr:hypothetical protein [Mycolicibacterium rutilum]SEH77188.1 hypothetical protein SAMN04489835_3939 [Mycolicibacterium rutilum]
MSWPVRVGMGVAVLAALALGRAVESALPVAHTDNRPFLHTAGVGEPVHMRYADVTADAVRSARALDTPQGEVGTPGRWLIVSLTVTPRGRPLSSPAVSLQDAKGRTFAVDARSGYSWEAAPTGVRWQVDVPFEVPYDALPGAALLFSHNPNDDRRDDVARIDLGLDAGDAERLWATASTVEVSPAQMATS